MSDPSQPLPEWTTPVVPSPLRLPACPRLRLFRAPYVDESGTSRERVCGVLTGIDDDALGSPLVKSVKEAFDRLAGSPKPTLLILADDLVEVEWLG